MVRVEAEAIDMLLCGLPHALVCSKDAERFLLWTPRVHIQSQDHHFKLDAEACGEELDSQKHGLLADVIAVTSHRLRVRQTEAGWRATVTSDA